MCDDVNALTGLKCYKALILLQGSCACSVARGTEWTEIQVAVAESKVMKCLWMLWQG